MKLVKLCTTFELLCCIYLLPFCTFPKYLGTGWAISQIFLDFHVTRVHLGHMFSSLFSTGNLEEVKVTTELNR